MVEFFDVPLAPSLRRSTSTLALARLKYAYRWPRAGEVNAANVCVVIDDGPPLVSWLDFSVCRAELLVR